MPLILGIESSCDETAVAVVKDGAVLSNVISSQTVHADFGGVVPELAAREHMTNILSIAERSLQKANTPLSAIDIIACTEKPGLISCLMVGSQFAKSLSLSLGKPFYSINHLEAHIASACMDHPTCSPPYLCLLASGGHTQIVHCRSWMDMEIIGQTLDDAAGEAFDKSARLLGFNYNGGRLIDEYAQNGDAKKFVLPQPRIENLDYSFSGLKTAIRYLIEDECKKDKHFIDNHKADLCASIQRAIVESLIKPLLIAAKQLNITTITLAGGVAANSFLRKRMQEECQKRNYTLLVPALEYCTDNGAMIAFLAEKLIQTGVAPHGLSSSCMAKA